MSGNKGCITEASSEFNELRINDTIKGIKTADRVNAKIREGELAKAAAEANKPKEEEIDSHLLTEEIKDEMEL